MFLKLLLACGMFCMADSSLSIGEITHGVIAGEWLFKYGYESSYDPKITEEELKEGIKNMQRFASLPVTGKLDDATLNQMSLPRCGRRDPILKVNTRSKRYIHQGSDWKMTFREKKKMELRWTLKNSGRSLRYDTVLIVMREAFRFWQAKTNIDFIEISKEEIDNGKYKEEEIEILVSFVNGWHHDPYAFDGEGGTLAHAFYPLSNKGLSGDVHFDDAEWYTYKSPKGRNLLWVATHELGHSLGLEHSNVREAVMFPWYTKYKPGFQLHEDDILGLQTLYGSRTKPMPGTGKRKTTTTTQAPTKATKPPIQFTKKCPKFDGSVITGIYYSRKYRQNILFTSKNKIYLTGYNSRVPILDRFSYLPRSKIANQINAVLTTKINGTESQLYFAGSKYYVYNDFRFSSGPHSIYYGKGPLKLKFPRNIRKIDAALTYYRNGRIYFFSGTQYWRYNNKKQKFDAKYPKSISVGWKGLPSKVDAALSSASKRLTFFTSNKKYYVFDDNKFQVKGIYSINTLLECKNAPMADVGYIGELGDGSSIDFKS